MKLESVLRKKETPPTVQAVAESNPTPAREALRVFRDGELAEAHRVADDAASATETARATMAERERASADARQRAQAAATANDREGFRTARLDVEFDEQQLAIAQQRVSACEDQQSAIAQRFVGLDQRRRDLVVAVLMETAHGHESELHRLEAECLKHFAALDATLNHFRTEKVVGRPVEDLAEIFQRLRAFAILTDENRVTSQAALRELLGNL
jgi:hypothetical protein